MSEPKVVCIDRVTPVPQSVGDPVESVIKLLEELLERARSGSLSGIACALYFSDGDISWRLGTGRFRYSAMIGAIEIVKADLVNDIVHGADERHEPPTAS